MIPLIGETDLSTGLLIVFALCLFAVVAFEFVNGFHDTANAVATVIYTKALKPIVAIPWSGFWNFLGVFAGGIAVAMGILKLVPLDTLMALPVSVGACLVLSVLLAAIIWNLGTWYFGIPCSSSHTLIGALIGAGIGFTWYYGGSGVNWHKAEEIGLSLIQSPFIGFGLAVLLMLFLKHVVRYKALFHIPQGEDDRPPFLVRGILILTCTLVSFFHGSNDGQKGVGLFMLILIAFLPARFAINHSVPDAAVIKTLDQTEIVLQTIASSNVVQGTMFAHVHEEIEQVKLHLMDKSVTDKAGTFKFRKEIEGLVKSIATLESNKRININAENRLELNRKLGELKHLTDFAPIWVILTISVALG